MNSMKQSSMVGWTGFIAIFWWLMLVRKVITALVQVGFKVAPALSLSWAKAQTHKKPAKVLIERLI